jgi:hypothetical protein
VRERGEGIITCACIESEEERACLCVLCVCEERLGERERERVYKGGRRGEVCVCVLSELEDVCFCAMYVCVLCVDVRAFVCAVLRVNVCVSFLFYFD